MNREIRSLYLLGLTLLLFGFKGLLTNGAFIFPFPLNDFFFFALVIFFSVLNYKNSTPIILLGISSFLAVAANPFLWEILLSAEQLEKFLHAPWIPLIFLLSVVCMLIWGIVFATKQGKTMGALISILGVGCLAYGIFNGITELPLIAYLLLSISAILKPVYQPFHLLWIALFALELTKLISHLAA